MQRALLTSGQQHECNWAGKASTKNDEAPNTSHITPDAKLFTKTPERFTKEVKTCNIMFTRFVVGGKTICKQQHFWSTLFPTCWPLLYAVRYCLQLNTGPCGKAVCLLPGVYPPWADIWQWYRVKGLLVILYGNTQTSCRYYRDGLKCGDCSVQYVSWWVLLWQWYVTGRG